MAPRRRRRRGARRPQRAGSALALPRLEPGYHRLAVAAGGQSSEATLIAAPARCWEPRAFTEGARAWGLAAQLYSFRSGGDLGIGTYADAGEAAAGAGALGASFLGLSPVHALFAADRAKISPYSPSSRLFLETLHIDPSAVPGFAGSRAARLLAEAAPRIAALREGALVDHLGVWSVLRPVFDALFADIRARGGDPAFDGFPPRTRRRRSKRTPPSRPCRSISGPRARGGRANGRRRTDPAARRRCAASATSMPSASRSTPGCNGSPTRSWRPLRRAPMRPA